MNDRVHGALAPATAGDIALVNLHSARLDSWGRFQRMPTRPGTAEALVEQEQLTAQFAGDLAAFDRLETMADAFTRARPEPARAAMINAQVACSTHRFAHAGVALERARACGAPAADTERLALAIDQATGENLRAVLAARRQRAAKPGAWAELLPLGALLADLGEFDEAESIYLRALHEYPDVSPFALAWACFQLGVLWGECIPSPDGQRAAQWYRSAIDYLPCYVKARVHLSETCLDEGDPAAARALLEPALSSGDPEVHWRLADVAVAMNHQAQAHGHLQAARDGFEALLARHPLAFADHGAEFYLGSGNDARRALELAQLNRANRPTLRAFEQAHAAALAAGEATTAALLARDGRERWGGMAAFAFSSLAARPEEP